MKLLITLFLSGITCAAHSQFSAGMHTGASNKNMIVGLQAQYEFKARFTAGVNMTAHADNRNPAFLQSRFGYTLGNREGLSVEPYAGYSYRLQNIEQKDYASNFSAGIQCRYCIKTVAVIYADMNIPDNHYRLFSLGIAGKLQHR